MTLVIEKGIPMPPARASSEVVEALRKMEIGDSVLIPNLNTNQVTRITCRLRAKSGRRFTARQTNKGVRVWRTQ